MPLTMAGDGIERPIRRIGGSPSIRAHLQDLGFVEGQLVRVVADVGGSLIVQVSEARVAIGRELAVRILV